MLSYVSETTPGAPALPANAPVWLPAGDTAANRCCQAPVPLLASRDLWSQLQQIEIQMNMFMIGLLLGLMKGTGARPPGAPTSQGSAPASPAESVAGRTPPLTGSGGETASRIDRHLASQNSPAANQGTGAEMVRAGQEHNVDPLILLAIAGHETVYGKKGVGVRGMLGVGAYDSDPNNSTRNPTFSGIQNQVRLGASTFAKLRAKGGASASDPVEAQLQAVNRAGWATDSNWHKGVLRIYQQLRSGS